MSKKEEELENQGLKVRDRRRFSADGTPLENASAPRSETVEEKSSATEAPPASPEAWHQELPADFASLVLSLTAAAQSALEKDRFQAKYHIDLLGILAEKTKGNLSSEEEKLLQALLYDLRMRFVEAGPGKNHPDRPGVS